MKGCQETPPYNTVTIAIFNQRNCIQLPQFFYKKDVSLNTTVNTICFQC